MRERVYLSGQVQLPPASQAPSTGSGGTLPSADCQTLGICPLWPSPSVLLLELETRKDPVPSSFPCGVCHCHPCYQKELQGKKNAHKLTDNMDNVHTFVGSNYALVQNTGKKT